MSHLVSATENMSEKKDLIKRTVCKGCSDDEAELFFMVCQRTGLDPFMRQIYPVKRWDNREKKQVMSLQTSIDGFRLIAERTESYSPGREPTFVYDVKKLVSATAYVKKMTKDGTWHEVAATAYFNEYVQTSKEGHPTQFWERMPHVMLAKCAEALALRKAFPAQMSGIYTADEMGQAKNVSEEESIQVIEEKPAGIGMDQIETIENLLSQITDGQYLTNWEEYVEKTLKISSIHELKAASYDKIVASLTRQVMKEREEENGSQALA